MTTDKVKQLLSEYHHILLSKRRLNVITKELSKEKNRYEDLRSKVQKELDDILKLEKQSLKTMFVHFLKNKEEQMEKENQEYLLAALEYNECQNVMEILEYEIQVLSQKLNQEEYLLKDIERQIVAIPDEILLSEPIYIQEYKGLTEDINKLYSLTIEAKEALDCTKDLKKSFSSLTRYLNSAKKYDAWGLYYDEKQKAKAKRKSYIDKAQKEVYILKKLLIILNDELTDVIEFKEQLKRSEAMIRGFNISYYQYLIKDWIENKAISDTLEMSLIGTDHIKNLITSLKKMIEETENESDSLLKKRDELVAIYLK